MAMTKANRDSDLWKHLHSEAVYHGQEFAHGQSEVAADVLYLIATAHANGVEPVTWLTHCLRHAEDLAKRPAEYLPWACRDLRPQAPSVPRAAHPSSTG
jgi:hypothetical protein